MAPPISTAVLRSVPLFSSVPEEQLRLLTTVVTRRSTTRGSIIVAGGDAPDSLYIVLSGRLKVMMSDADGKEVILSILGPGEFFGEMGLIDDNPRSASVVAIEPCELLAITRRDFKKCMTDQAEMAGAVRGGARGRTCRSAASSRCAARPSCCATTSCCRSEPGARAVESADPMGRDGSSEENHSSAPSRETRQPAARGPLAGAGGARRLPAAHFPDVRPRRPGLVAQRRRQRDALSRAGARG